MPTFSTLVFCTLSVIVLCLHFVLFSFAFILIYILYNIVGYHTASDGVTHLVACHYGLISLFYVVFSVLLWCQPAITKVHYSQGPL